MRIPSRPAALLALFAIVYGVSGQTPYQAKAIQEAASPHFEVRAHAMAMLARDDSPRSREELINLLSRESGIIERNYRKEMAGLPDAESPASGDNEGYAEYVGQLFDIVMKVAEDPRYAQALAVLVKEGPDPGTQAAKWLAMHGEQIVPYVMQLAKSDLDVQRSSATGLATNLLELERAGKIKLLPDHRRAAKEMILKGLKDASMMPREESIIALGAVGDAEDLLPLQSIASSDPTLDDDHRVYPLRAIASQAIAGIKQRQAALTPVAVPK